MARFAHTVTVAALDRGWFEEAAGTLVDLLDASREGPGGSVVLADGRPVEGLRLLKGRHLRPGARYGEFPAVPEGAGEVPVEHAGAEAGDSPDAPQAVVLRTWRPSHSVEAESLVEEDGMSLKVGLRLSEPRRPRAVELSLSGHKPGGGSLYRFSGRGKADLAAWWAAVDRLPSAPPAARAPVSGRAVHRLAEARLTLTPRPAEGGSWRITVVLSMRGRWLLRPVGAVVLFFARGPVERGLREAAESAAGEWNTALAGLTPLHGEALRAEIADALVNPDGATTL
ncbi:hypothetical protein F2B00_14405 [Streptomyces parvus]|uniref:hypothetical protein n=1 Tax=Streptomyces parvus TaxID=66428 RepID=UPI00123C2F3A|nr:hypothetical protein [Streptomyces parvus]KAA6201579.1 hypothetical protein F2B00_14405 [Streptomyces parvus]GGS12891.1 hypothetical protein GCM10010221_07020 [Streptomyces parvus]